MSLGGRGGPCQKSGTTSRVIYTGNCILFHPCRKFMYYQICELKSKYDNMLDLIGWKDVPDRRTKNIGKTSESDGNSATRKEKFENKDVVSLPRMVDHLIFTLLFNICRVGTNFLVVLLQRRQIFTSLRELALLHTLANIPVNECTLGVH